MNFVYLQEFLILAETKNYSEAADRLYMSQSALSRHIKSLELELNVPLFERTTRHVRLTEFGEHLLPYARQITGLTYQYEAELMNKSERLLTIGSIPTMAQYDIVEFMLAFKEKYPDIRIKIVEDDTLVLKRGLLNRKYEVAFIRDGNPPFSTAESADSMLEKIPYQSDYAVALIPRGHPLYGAESITLPELKGHRLCMLKEGTLFFNICVRACQAVDFVPNIFFESHRINNIISMSIKGSCVAILLSQHMRQPDGQYTHDDENFSIVKILPEITTTVSIAYLKTEKVSDSAMKFLKYFSQTHISRTQHK